MKLIVKKQYQVGGHIYTVVLDADLEKQNDWGVTDHISQRIYINPFRAESQMTESLIHELIHIVDEVFLHHELGEVHVSNLAQGLLQIIIQHEIKLDWSEIPYKSNEILPQGEKEKSEE